jgi:hypothetical protein
MSRRKYCNRYANRLVLRGFNFGLFYLLDFSSRTPHGRINAHKLL